MSSVVVEVSEYNPVVSVYETVAQIVLSDAGPQGATGPAGSSGVVSVTSPVTNSGTSSAAVIGLNQDAFDHISSLAYAQFDTANTTSPTTPGRLAWNQNDGTLDLYLKDGGVTLQVGQESVLRVVNKTGAALDEGAVVYLSGAQGQRVKALLASNSSDVTSESTIGVVTHSGGIANNQEGFVTTQGLVRGLNLSSYTDGDQLWLGATAGTFTNVEPTAPAANIRIGWVVNATAQGSILVSVQSNPHLYQLNDVVVSSPASGNLLVRNSANTLWENKPQSVLTVAKTQVTGTALVRDDVARWSGATSSFVETIPRFGLSASAILTQNATFTFFTPLIDDTVSQITMVTGATLASGLTLARMGLYTVDGSDNATLVARTANDTTLFTSTNGGANTPYTRSFDTTGGYPASYNLVAGQRYALGVLCVGTTMPTLVSTNLANTQGAATLAPRMTAQVGGQSDLPTSRTTYGSAFNVMLYGRLS